MDTFISIIIILMPLIALCISCKMLKLDNNKSKVVTIVVFILFMCIALIISIYRIFLSANNGPFEMLKKNIFLMIFIILWLFGTNKYFDKVMRKFMSLNMYYYLIIKIIVSLILLNFFISLIYTKFVLNIGRYNSLEEYVGYFLVYTIGILFFNMLLKALKCWNRISKIVDCFDCIDFIYILSLNTLLLTLNNINEVIHPVCIFTITISFYSDRERIIKYYFGGDYETT